MQSVAAELYDFTFPPSASAPCQQAGIAMIKARGGVFGWVAASAALVDALA
jgi:hypothetical protein